MVGYEDLQMRIGRDYIQFHLDGTDYEGPTDFGPGTLEKLRQACSIYRPWQEYGSALFSATFQENALQGYQRLRGAVESGRRFRLRLNIQSQVPQIHRLWWECLYDPTKPPYRLGCGLLTPMSRYLWVGASRRSQITKPLKVLLVISNPEDLGQAGGKWASYPRLDEDEERRTVEDILKSLREGGHVEYDWQDKPASLQRIRHRLSHEGFHVLHFVGHGGFLNDKGYLLLEKDDDETVDPVGEERLAELVAWLPELQLVVLAACFSAKGPQLDAFGGLAPSMVEYGVPAVVAMQQQVAQTTAQQFTKAFYGALLTSKRTQGLVDAAVNAAREELFVSLFDDDPWAWALPVLFMRGDGKLFETAEMEPGVSGLLDPQDQIAIQIGKLVLQGWGMRGRADKAGTAPVRAGAGLPPAGDFSAQQGQAADVAAMLSSALGLPSTQGRVARAGSATPSLAYQSSFGGLQLANMQRAAASLDVALKVTPPD